MLIHENLQAILGMGMTGRPLSETAYRNVPTFKARDRRRRGDRGGPAASLPHDVRPSAQVAVIGTEASSRAAWR
jgi:hypothetical protein